LHSTVIESQVKLLEVVEQGQSVAKSEKRFGFDY